MQTDAEAGSQGFTLLMVETDGLEGFTRGQPLHKVGQHAQDTCELLFEDVPRAGRARASARARGSTS